MKRRHKVIIVIFEGIGSKRHEVRGVSHFFMGAKEFLAPSLVYGEVICKEVIFPVSFDTQNSLANKKGQRFST